MPKRNTPGEASISPTATARLKNWRCGRCGYTENCGSSWNCARATCTAPWVPIERPTAQQGKAASIRAQENRRAVAANCDSASSSSAYIPALPGGGPETPASVSVPNVSVHHLVGPIKRAFLLGIIEKEANNSCVLQPTVQILCGDVNSDQDNADACCRALAPS